MEKAKRNWAFRIISEMRKYRGMAKRMAEEMGKSRHTIYYQLRVPTVPNYERVQVPYTAVFNSIAWSEFTPEYLFSVDDAER